MKTQPIDKQIIKLALLELIQSDRNFVLQMLELFMQELSIYQNPLPHTTQLSVYQQSLPLERQEKQLALTAKYEHKKGINPTVIQALQAEFADAPAAEEMIKLLQK